MSCHTTLAYALARGILGRAADDPPSPAERQVWESVAARVRLWDEIEPAIMPSGCARTWTAAPPESSSIGSSVRAWYHDVRTTSDGCATGLATFVLLEAGTPRTNVQVERGLAWLVRNQDGEGFWRAASLNKERDPSSDVGRFMSDAATAYAALALARAGLPAR